jgi:hypothetical protein
MRRTVFVETARLRATWLTFIRGWGWFGWGINLSFVTGLAPWEAGQLWNHDRGERPFFSQYCSETAKCPPHHRRRGVKAEDRTGSKGWEKAEQAVSGRAELPLREAVAVRISANIRRGSASRPSASFRSSTTSILRCPCSRFEIKDWGLRIRRASSCWVSFARYLAAARTLPTVLYFPVRPTSPGGSAGVRRWDEGCWGMESICHTGIVASQPRAMPARAQRSGFSADFAWVVRDTHTGWPTA